VYPAYGFAAAVKHGCIMVILIELMQLLSLRHCFDSASLLLRVLAVILGGWVAAFVVHTSQVERWKRRPGFALPTAVLVPIGIAQVLIMFGSAIQRQVGYFAAMELGQVNWVPFETLWLQPMDKMAADVLSGLVTFGALALTVVIVLRRAGWSRVWVATGAVVIGSALAVEVLRAATSTYSADTTMPIVAAVAVGGAYWLLRLLPVVPEPTRAPVLDVPTAHEPVYGL
jgi:hypothetical protein